VCWCSVDINFSLIFISFILKYLKSSWFWFGFIHVINVITVKRINIFFKSSLTDGLQINQEVFSYLISVIHQ